MVVEFMGIMKELSFDFVFSVGNPEIETVWELRGSQEDA